MSDHIDVDLLADRQEGLVDAAAAAEIDAHLAVCARCRASADDLRGVSEVLRTQPAPAMPAQAAERIARAVAEEQRTRRDTTPVTAVDHARRRRTRTARVLLAAAAAVVVVGVGGTLLDDVGLGGGTRSESGTLSPREDAASGDAGAGQASPHDAGERFHSTQEPPREPSVLREDGAGNGAGEVAPRVQSELSLIEEVFVTRTVVPLRQRSECVGSALDEPGWEGTSYAVQVHGQPGAVAFLGDVDNTARGVEGILVRCGRAPAVLERQLLRP